MAFSGPGVGSACSLAPRTNPRELVGLVELHGVDQLARRAAPAFQVLLVVADRGAVGVQHQVASRPAPRSWPARRGAASAGRQQQQPRRADAVGAQHDRAGGLELHAAVAVDRTPRRWPARARRSRPCATRAPVTHLRAGLERLRHVDQVEGGLGALRAAPLADAPAAALLERLVLLARDRVGAGPPVPAELVGRLGGLACPACPAGAAAADSPGLRGRRCRRRRPATPMNSSTSSW